MLKRTLTAASLAVVLALPAAPAGGQSETQSPTHGYRRALVLEGRAFPVLRSNWYSVINFRNDWHAPRMRFENGRWRQIGVHEGNDVMAEPGTPVVAMTDGVVERVGWLFYSGWRVGVRGADGRYWFYAHLSEFEPGLAEGRTVQAGQALGRVGNTGYGTDPGHSDEFVAHLHVGIQEPDGTWTNPFPLLRSLYRKTVKLQ
ncbi:MAG: M23 family metallopeptidase [Actinomycetota bacterium]